MGKKTDPSVSVACGICGASAGSPCVYTDGAFKGERKLSGAHGSRLSAVDAQPAPGVRETPSDKDGE